MGRIRTVKPELVHDQRVATLGDTARILYYAALAVVDDAGRAQAAPGYLHGVAFWGQPRQLNKVAEAILELERAQIWRIYDANGGKYLEVIGWADEASLFHQRIDKPQRSSLPPPRSIHSENDPGTIRERSERRRGRTTTRTRTTTTTTNTTTNEPETPGVHILRDCWLAGYLAKHQTEYVLSKADFGSLKWLETNLGIEEAKLRMQIAFTAPPSWPAQPWDLKTFVSRINQCAKPTEPSANTDVRTGRVEPQTDPAAYGDGDQEI